MNLSTPSTRTRTTAPGVLDRDELFQQLNTDGVALTPPLLDREQCREIAALFDEPRLFRSTVVMQRYQFGRGSYKYFADPAVIPLVGRLREELYPLVAWMANQWAPQLKERSYPATLDELLAECAAGGQTRPTPLLLRYDKGDYACLHQDVYGDIVFPSKSPSCSTSRARTSPEARTSSSSSAPAPSPGRWSSNRPSARE